MSPEQVEGRVKDISPRTDVYSLGAILYEIVTGHVPHEGETMLEIYGRIVHDDPKPPMSLNPAAPRDLQTVALKALEKDPQRRYANAQEFANDLARWLAGEPVLARPRSPAYRLYRAVRKSRVARVAALALGVALLAWAAVGIAVREKSGRLDAEKEKNLTLLREHARTSLEAVLGFRRAGANEKMKQFVPGLEASYRQALESAPEVAEVEYLMGRMHRALMEEEKALGFQERALKKDPSYAPALYERAVLLAGRYGSGLTKAVADARRLPPGPITAQTSRSIPLPDPVDVEEGSQELVAIRETILKDCTALEGLLARSPEAGRPRPVGDANVLTVKGILAFCRLSFPEAQRLLQDAVQKDPTLEEAWGALCETVYRQANLQSRQSTNAEEIIRLYEAAEALYGKAIFNDMGFVPHWVGRADVRRHGALYLMGRGKDGRPLLREAEADLTRALQFTGEAPEPWFLRTSVRELAGVCQMDHAENPEKDLVAAEEDLGVILSRWGDRASAWCLKGSIHNERARWRRRSGGDPLPEYDAAEKAFEHATKLDPRDIESLMDRGQTRMFRSEWKSSRGMDPLPDFESAERDFSEALRSMRHTVRPWEMRAQTRYFRGAYRLGRGADALEDFTQAEEDFTEALRVNPVNPRAIAYRGRTRGRLAGLMEKKGETAEAVRLLGAAVEDLARAFELNKGLASEMGAEAAEYQKRLAQLAPK